MDTKYFFLGIASIFRFKAPVNAFACFKVSPTGKGIKTLTEALCGAVEGGS